MNAIRLGDGSLLTSRLSYGCWRLTGAADAERVTPEKIRHGKAAVIAAFEAGYTLFDNADIYCDGLAESLFGEVLREIPGMRSRVVIATKCGIRKAGTPDLKSPYRYDFSAAHILRSCEQSLRRLKVETVDLYQLHRPDLLADPGEVAGAFMKLREQGKVREFGVSNFAPSQLEMLQSYCSFKLIVNQIEISLAHLDPFRDGALDQCVTRRITPMAWSPLAGGWLVGPPGVDMMDPHHARKLRLHETIEAVARERGFSRAVVCVGWLLSHPAGIVPIIGTTDPTRIRELAAADSVQVTRDEWYRLYEAACGQRLP